MTPTELKEYIKENPDVVLTVSIAWVDADHDSGWQPHDPEADDEAEEMFSEGPLVSVGYKFITISNCYNSGAKEWLGKHRVPLGMVTDIEILKERRFPGASEE
jgi:hypothetical protein